MARGQGGSREPGVVGLEGGLSSKERVRVPLGRNCVFRATVLQMGSQRPGNSLEMGPCPRAVPKAGARGQPRSVCPRALTELESLDVCVMAQGRGMSRGSWLRAPASFVLGCGPLSRWGLAGCACLNLSNRTVKMWGFTFFSIISCHVG